MPIKICQNCGLKVFIEEGRPLPVPFLCVRCQATMRAMQVADRQQSMPMMDRPRKVATEAPAPTPAALTPAPAPQPAKLQLTCPGCGATFSAKPPETVARGKCPKCLQPLMVYPDGVVVLAKPATVASTPADTAAAEPAVAPSQNADAAPLSSSRIGRPTRPPQQPALTRETATAMTTVTPAGTQGTEPVSMEGPQSDISDGVPGAGAGASAPAAEAPAAEIPATEAPPAGAPAAEAPAAPAQTQGAEAGGAAKPEHEQREPARPGPRGRRPPYVRPEAPAAPKGDSTGKITFTVIAVALPVVVGLVLFSLRDQAAVVNLLDEVCAPFKKGLSVMTETKAPPKPGKGTGKVPATPEKAPQAPATPASPEGAGTAPAPASPDTQPPKPETPAPAPPAPVAPPSPAAPPPAAAQPAPPSSEAPPSPPPTPAPPPAESKP